MDDHAQLTYETTQIKDGLILRQRAKTAVSTTIKWLPPQQREKLTFKIGK